MRRAAPGRAGGGAGGESAPQLAPVGLLAEGVRELDAVDVDLEAIGNRTADARERALPRGVAMHDYRSAERGLDALDPAAEPRVGVERRILERGARDTA